MHFECGEEEKKRNPFPYLFFFFFLHLLWKFSASEGLGALSTCCRVFLGRHDLGRSLEGTRGGEGCDSRRPRWCERRPPERYHTRSHLFVEWRFHFRKVKKEKEKLRRWSETRKCMKSKVGNLQIQHKLFKYLQAFSGGSRGKNFPYSQLRGGSAQETEWH